MSILWQFNYCGKLWSAVIAWHLQNSRDGLKAEREGRKPDSGPVQVWVWSPTWISEDIRVSQITTTSDVTVVSHPSWQLTTEHVVWTPALAKPRPPVTSKHTVYRPIVRPYTFVQRWRFPCNVFHLFLLSQFCSCATENSTTYLFLTWITNVFQIAAASPNISSL